VDQITQLKGISNINVFGAGQYAMRFWVKPDQLAKLNLTVNDIITAINAQNTPIPPVWLAARRHRKDRNSPTPSPRRAGSSRKRNLAKSSFAKIRTARSCG
jgi:hypothetical protein